MSVSYLPNENNLHLENNLVSDVFAPNRLAALEMIASQAAISLAQSRLYAELARANKDLKRETNERRLAEAELHKREVSLREARSELAHFSRISTMVELAASIAHEVNQPIAGILMNANAGLHWLSGDSPDLTEVRETLRRITRDGSRASEIVARIRALAKKASPQNDPLNLNDLIVEVIAMVSGGLQENRVLLETKLLPDLPSLSPGPTGLQPLPDMLARLSRAPVVSIASIRGHATGVGSELALASSRTGQRHRTARKKTRRTSLDRFFCRRCRG